MAHWTHIEEGTRMHYQKSTTVESTEEAERKAKKRLASNLSMKDGTQLERNYQTCLHKTELIARK